MSVLLTIMCSFFAFAGGVKYLSGNKKLFKTAEGGMLLEISSRELPTTILLL